MMQATINLWHFLTEDYLPGAMSGAADGYGLQAGHGLCCQNVS